MDAIELAISLTFIAELALRMGCYLYVEMELDNFLIDPFNAVDVLVVLVDVILLISVATSGVDEEADSGNGAGLVKVRRLIR